MLNMADSSVRVDGSVKEELDRLQGLVQAETGERVSQSELLRLLLRFARLREAEFLASRSEPAWRPPTRADLARLRRRLEPWGEPSDASRVDDVLYGGEDA